MKKTILYIPVVAIALASCTKSQFNSQTYSTGKANFSNFISVGNSLTQGYMDGGLYYYGQSHSYPSIIAQQVKLADPNMSFLQPMVTGNGSGYIHLVYLNGQLTPIQPGDDSTAGPNPCDADPSWNLSSATWSPTLQNYSYNNLGIAGILLVNCTGSGLQAIENNVITGYQDIAFLGGWIGNPFGRFLNFGAYSSSPTIQYLNFVKSSKATFFTCWLGDNDVLGYATSGGVSTSETITGFGTVTFNAITPPAVFASDYDSVLLAFHNMGSQGICVTIPNVTSIPFFTTVPSYITVNGAQQALWITTKTGVRQATNSDYILLSEYNAVLAGQGVYESNPIPNNEVLDETEADSVINATAAYNASIKSLAAQYGFPVLDMNTFFSTALKTSATIDGVTLSRQYIQGGGFGLDGVHPTALGYALIANQFIATINANWGANIPPVAESNYRGVLFPSY